MLIPAFLWVFRRPNIWVRIGAFNLSLAIVMGAFYGIAFRSFLLLAVAKDRTAASTTGRILKGVVFLVLGTLYAVVAWPMIAWDHPARVLAAVTVVLPPLMAGIRHAKGWGLGFPKVVRTLVSSFLILVLFAAALATLLRAGFITLKADRVPLVLDVTGETRAESIPAVAGSGTAVNRRVTAHHIILWLWDGSRGPDVWVYGDRVAFVGRAILFSRPLNILGVPNLYEFREIRNGAASGGGTGNHPAFSMPFPHPGPLAVRPWWRSIQLSILNAWQAAIDSHSLCGIRSVENSSPYYPLVGPGGEPVRKRYLLDLTLDGIPTSRGSSPLESR
jgi:hypothetical protein